jgi:LuxR family quorum sensing-dependent transcriptional regulator
MQIIEDFIDTSNKAQSLEVLFNLYKEAMRKLGFDRLIFSLMTDHMAIQRRAGHGIFFNYPEDWMKYYVEKNFEVIDPVRRQMYVAPSIFTWDGVMQLPTITENQSRFMNEGNEAKLYDGIGVPLRGPRGAIAGIGAASSTGGVELKNPNLLSYVNLLSQQFYTVYLTLEMQQGCSEEHPFVYLTDREQEVMKWLANGKTKSEIGDIIGISEHTVHTHVKTSLKKLDANNTTLGVLKALQMGLIQL